MSNENHNLLNRAHVFKKIMNVRYGDKVPIRLTQYG